MDRLTLALKPMDRPRPLLCQGPMPHPQFLRSTHSSTLQGRTPLARTQSVPQWKRERLTMVRSLRVGIVPYRQFRSHPLHEPRHGPMPYPQSLYRAGACGLPPICRRARLGRSTKRDAKLFEIVIGQVGEYGEETVQSGSLAT
jgi:hypothetical protein